MSLNRKTLVMLKMDIMLTLIFICSSGPGLYAGKTNDKHLVDWWCDQTECFYSDTIPKEEKCESNSSIPYRFNSTTGVCELNLKGLFLSLRVVNNRLGLISEEKSRKRTEIIFQGIIISGEIFVGFVGVCVFLACFYCGWLHYTNRKLRKNVTKVSKKVQAQQKLNKSKQNCKNTDDVHKDMEKISNITAKIQVSVV